MHAISHRNHPSGLLSPHWVTEARFRRRTRCHSFFGAWANVWITIEEAIWLTASGGGDVDTTCAMVGGIVAAYTGVEGIPVEWVQAREPLPEWALAESVS